VIFALSVLSYRLVEAPIRNSTRLKQRHPAISVAIGLTLVVLTLAVTLAVGAVQ
jgi:peptidoglycan/LPS O-acetylase OafA/YrhL